MKFVDPMMQRRNLIKFDVESQLTSCVTVLEIRINTFGQQLRYLLDISSLQVAQEFLLTSLSEKNKRRNSHEVEDNDLPTYVKLPTTIQSSNSSDNNAQRQWWTLWNFLRRRFSWRGWLGDDIGGCIEAVLEVTLVMVLELMLVVILVVMEATEALVMVVMEINVTSNLSIHNNSLPHPDTTQTSTTYPKLTSQSCYQST